MLVRELVRDLHVVRQVTGPEVDVLRLAYDSRNVQPGDLFVAVRGASEDGNRFASEAVRRGAVAVASEEPHGLPAGVAQITVDDSRIFLAEASRVVFGDPAAHMTLVGVTGTNGKTTTVQLLNSIFWRAGHKSCAVGTLGFQRQGELRRGRHTTPEAPGLYAFLAESRASGCDCGALEISSHALSLRRVYGMSFAVGVFTNLTQDHLDFHSDLESYFQAKNLLFTCDGHNGISTAILNTDDPYGSRIAADTSASVLSFGFREGTDIRISARPTERAQSDVRIESPFGAVVFRSHLVGRFNLFNLMAAAGAAGALGIPNEAIATGLASVRSVPGRLEPVDVGQPFRVVVDYAHTPDALEGLLSTLRELTQGRVVAVFGCGGDRDRTKRAVMGRIASRGSDLVVATSDNPRHEDPDAILAEIERGLSQGATEYRIIRDRKEAIRAALMLARAGDSVVIAGKGHEDYQLIGNRRIPFDDRVVARELLQEIATAASGTEDQTGPPPRQVEP